MIDATPAINVVGKYVDGLVVSVFGKPKMSVFEDLRTEKRTLRASPHGEWDFCSIPGVPGGPLMLTTQGGSTYQFILHNGAISRLEVTRRGRLPEVMIQFRAEALHEHTLEKVNTIAEAVADHFLEMGFEVKVSSVHVALDFQCAEWRWPEVDDIVCRARRPNIDYYNRVVTAMTYGKRHAPLQIQLYDKTQEAKDNNKMEQMESLWATKETYSKGLPVIRVEPRFSRRLLKAFGIESIADLDSSIGDLIGYAVGGERPWLRVASADSRGCPSNRREAAPLWREISDALLNGMPGTGRVRQRLSSSSPDPKRDCRTYITYAVRVAAWERVLGHHPADRPEEYLGPIALQHLPGWLEKKRYDSINEAVAFEVKKLMSSGKTPYASHNVV